MGCALHLVDKQHLAIDLIIKTLLPLSNPANGCCTQQLLASKMKAVQKLLIECSTLASEYLCRSHVLLESLARCCFLQWSHWALVPLAPLVIGHGPGAAGLGPHRCGSMKLVMLRADFNAA